MGAIDKVMGEIFFRGIPYIRYWRNDYHRLLKTSYLMGMKQCYVLSYTSSRRLPWLLFLVVANMLQQGMVYAWAPTLLAIGPHCQSPSLFRHGIMSISM